MQFGIVGCNRVRKTKSKEKRTDSNPNDNSFPSV